MKDYLAINKASWNKRTEVHYTSDFYDNASFIKGRNSLNDIEMSLLGDLRGKNILHLQCHFGQDTISLARLGAKATGIDLSDAAIHKASELAKITKEDVQFICCDVYDLPNHLNEKFDIVFTSYGTIGWLPDMDLWAGIIYHFLKPGGEFVFAEFHPVVWMFDDHFKKIQYNYFNVEVIAENIDGTYTDGQMEGCEAYVSWNHNLAEVISSLLKQGLRLTDFEEFDYSPYNCFKETYTAAPGKYRIKHLDAKIPMVYALKAVKDH